MQLFLTVVEMEGQAGGVVSALPLAGPRVSTSRNAVDPVAALIDPADGATRIARLYLRGPAAPVREIRRRRGDPRSLLSRRPSQLAEQAILKLDVRYGSGT
jgi:hypothetical protein